MMKRSFLQHLINWFADAGLPKWLRSWVASDQELREYEDDLMSMTTRLRAEADEWARSEGGVRLADEQVKFAVTRGESNRLRGKPLRRRSLAITAAVAALVLGILTAWQYQIALDIDPVPPVGGAVAADLDGVSDEIDALAKVINKSARNIENSAKRLPAAVSLASIRPDIGSLRSIARSPLDSASRNYGQALALLDQSLREQLVRPR